MKVEQIVLALVGVVLAYKFLLPMLEGFQNPSTKVDQPCPPNSVKCPSGDCRIKTDIYGLCD